MSYLIDTSVLARLANASDIQHADALRAVLELHRRNETIHVAPQVLIEFRSVATRPTGANGLGLSTAESESLSATFEASFPLLQETPSIYTLWKHLVASAGVIGKQVHDARLVAICQHYSVENVLTFNAGHFARLTAHAGGINVVNPASF